MTVGAMYASNGSQPLQDAKGTHVPLGPRVISGTRQVWLPAYLILPLVAALASRIGFERTSTD